MPKTRSCPICCLPQSERAPPKPPCSRGKGRCFLAAELTESTLACMMAHKHSHNPTSCGPNLVAHCGTPTTTMRLDCALREWNALPISCPRMTSRHPGAQSVRDRKKSLVSSPHYGVFLRHPRCDCRLFAPYCLDAYPLPDFRFAVMHSDAGQNPLLELRNARRDSPSHNTPYRPRQESAKA